MSRKNPGFRLEKQVIPLIKSFKIVNSESGYGGIEVGHELNRLMTLAFPGPAGLAGRNRAAHGLKILVLLVVVKVGVVVRRGDAEEIVVFLFGH